MNCLGLEWRVQGLWFGLGAKKGLGLCGGVCTCAFRPVPYGVPTNDTSTCEAVCRSCSKGPFKEGPLDVHFH